MISKFMCCQFSDDSTENAFRQLQWRKSVGAEEKIVSLILALASCSTVSLEAREGSFKHASIHLIIGVRRLYHELTPQLSFVSWCKDYYCPVLILTISFFTFTLAGSLLRSILSSISTFQPLYYPPQTIYPMYASLSSPRSLPS
jgi:hypothetical protein